jgi:hypothetical protein
MPIKPVTDWISTYEEIFFKEFKLEDQPLLFRKWVHQNTKGLKPAVYMSSPTVTEASFPPVNLPSAGTAVTTAAFISTAWFSYISSIVWSVPAPIPPFSVVSGVVWDVGLVSAAKASLQAALVKEFTKTPTAGPSAIKTISAGMGAAFFQASMALGILVNGMSLPTPTPVPLVVPDKIL